MLKTEPIIGLPGLRLDLFLSRRFSEYSRSAWQEWIRRGLVLVGGARAEPRLKLKGGEPVEVRLPGSAVVPDFESRVVYEDEALLVLDKPAGLIVHPLKESWLKNPEALLREAEPSVVGEIYRRHPRIAERGVSRLGLVHRLDRQTSGILVVAKTAEAQKNLLRQFKERSVDKRYRAVVRGCPLKKSWRVAAPIGKSGMSRNFVATPFGKNAETEFRVLKSRPTLALIEAHPLTGRTHQIRAHLSFSGFPVAGDFLFDKDTSGPPAPRLMLHAFKITIRRPQSGRPATFTAELPADFSNFWRLRRQAAG